MGRRDDGKVSGMTPYDDADPRTAAIRHDIERTRDEMEDTVNAIETRLSPARIKEQITSVKEHALDQFKDAKDQVKHEIVHDLEEAKFKVKNEIGEARAAVREATVGKVEHMVQRAGTQVRDAGTSVVGTIRENPIPAALVGVGLGWLLMNGIRGRNSGRSFTYSGYRGGDYRRGDMGVYGGYEGEFGARRRSYDVRGEQFGDEHFGEGDYSEYGNRAYGEDEQGGLQGRMRDVSEGARDFAHRAGDKVSDVADTVRERAGEFVETARHRVDDARDYAGRFVDDARERASHYVDEGRTQVYRAREGAERFFDESPLAVGAVAFAVGAAVALAIPTTEVEDRVFGEYKDRLLEGANEMAHGAIKSVEEKATQALHGAQEGGGEQKNAQGQGGENKQQQGLSGQSSERRI